MFSKLRGAHFTASRPVNLDLCQSSSGACDAGNVDHLCPSQQESLHAFRDCAQDILPNILTISDTDILRFLRARSFDVTKAISMYEGMLEWRKEVGADSIVERFQFPERKGIKELYPHFYHKTDKLGRPIYIERLGHLQLEEILKLTTMDRMLMHHIKELEILKDCKFPACSKKAGRMIMQSLTILDVKGLAMKAMNKQVRSFIQKIAQIDQDYYPEYLGKMFIVNALTAFQAVWAVIKPWLEKRTQRKIEVHGSNFTPKLLELVDADSLPEFLGGTCQCPEGCEHADVGPWKEVCYAKE